MDIPYLRKAFSQLKLRQIELNKKYIPICRNDVVIHVRGGDFLKISNLNICKIDYYKKSIKYALSSHIGFVVTSSPFIDVTKVPLFL